MSDIHPDILHLEACNFIDRPVGGQLTFSRHLMSVLGNRLALAGWTTSADDPVGRWFQKEIDGITYRYFAFARCDVGAKRPVLPARLTTLIQVRRYLSEILSIGITNIIMEEHSILMALRRNASHNVCYCFPGVASPLRISRYPFTKWLASSFDRFFFRALRHHGACILAAADESAIAGLIDRAGKALSGKKVVSFPTRVDTDVFHPAERFSVRNTLRLPVQATIAVTTGRIHWAKGWEHLLKSFATFQEDHEDALLVFVGDGPDRGALERQAADLGLQGKVITAGFHPSSVVAAYLQASDLYVMGSLEEGWSTALVEALACHLPIVTTRFSSADSVVKHGVNGFVVDGRDAAEFAKAMEGALSLSQTAAYSRVASETYALRNLPSDLFRVWPIQ